MVLAIDKAVALGIQQNCGTQAAARYLRRHGYTVCQAVFVLAAR